MSVAVENSDVWPTMQVFGAQRTESNTDQVMLRYRFETPWIRRRLELLDFDQGLVVPLGIVERGFKLCRG